MSKTETESSEVTASPPRDAFSTMRNEMERLFERFEHHFPLLPGFWSGTSGALVPSLDVRERDDAIVIEVDLPGVEEKDVSLTIANGNLTIRGEKKQSIEQKGENFYLSERTHGNFERTLRLPDSIDEAKIEAKFSNGVLQVTAKKNPGVVKAARKIEIKSAA
ncbi:MAG: Hsp20/alpha crystallin family protein [Rhodospirillales bacterium]|nr:Hsp20/alpha crystallin family protein [Rhodospirillales bacterium]